MRQRSGVRGSAFLAVVFLHSAALAGSTTGHPLPAAFIELDRCRRVEDAAVRLTCFDAASLALNRALVANELHIVDNVQIKAAKSSLFGLSVPNLGVFGDNGDGKTDDRLDELMGTVKSCRNTPDGWWVTLEDGTTWRQNDTVTSGIDPRPGQQVVIKRGALGSYRLMLNRNIGFKVRRVL
jgi:hypothetical protein